MCKKLKIVAFAAILLGTVSIIKADRLGDAIAQYNRLTNRTAKNALAVEIKDLGGEIVRGQAQRKQGGSGMFGGGGGQRGGRSQVYRGADLRYDLEISLEEAAARDQAAYEQFFASHDSDPVVSRYFENDDDIPDFDAASNASEEDFLRALGATDEDIQDAIATTRQPSSPQGSAAGNAGAQANEPAGPREGAGEEGREGSTTDAS